MPGSKQIRTRATAPGAGVGVEHRPQTIAGRTTVNESRLWDMNTSSTWPRNRLLLALPPRNLKQVMPDLEHIECHHEQVLLDADGSLSHVYFPDSGVVSVVAVYSNGSTIEMATIGREGGTGFQAIFGAKRSSARLLVQVPGTAARMSRTAFRRASDTIPAFRNLMLAHVHAFLEQVMVSAACNGAHSLTERLARWLLMMRDRNDSDDLPITQDLLAVMLGVHRPTVTNAARALQRTGLIDCSRKRISIRNRDGLIGASCECYMLVRARIAQHLPKTYPSDTAG
jgi:CRP-like cAMP-binding protein